MKKIACGSIQEYIKTHEALREYEELRSEALTMALFSKTESNKSAQAPVPMDISAVLDKIEENLAVTKAATDYR